MSGTANSFISPQSIKLASAVAVSANTALDAPTTAVSFTPPLIAGVSGAIVFRATALPRATVTATKCQLYRYAGGVYYYLAEALMPAYTMAQTTLNAATDFGFTETAPLRLLAGDELKFAIGVALAGGVVCTAQYEDLV